MEDHENRDGIPEEATETGETGVTAQPHLQAYPPITIEVTVRPVAPVNNLVGWADVKINGAFVIRGFRVLTGDKGLFVGVPSRSDGRGEYQDIAFPITSEAREQLNAAVVAAYNEAIQKMRAILYASEPGSTF